MMINKILFLTAIIISCPLLSGCAITYNFGPYTGQIVDTKTKEPIQGAVVYMQCFTQIGSPAGATSRYAGFKEVLTNDQGEFHLELRVTTFRIGHLWETKPFVHVFKPGYGTFPGHKNAASNTTNSLVLPPNKYSTISLPKLHTIKNRKRNLSYLKRPWDSRTEYEQWKNLFRLINIESKDLGMQLMTKPKMK